MVKLFRSKIYLALFLMFLVLLFGVLGYRFISDYSWIDAFYMTIITVTTVGFSEVRPMGPQGKIFTVLLIITSVFIVGFAISVITEYILSRNSLQLLKKKRVKNTIEKLSNHVVVCGFGRNGNKVIMPDKIGGDHMASLVVMPDLITFMDKLSMEGGDTTNLEEVAIEDFAGQVNCNSLRDLDLRKKTGCTIIGYIAPDGDYIINPEADLKLQPKSKVIVLGRPEQIRKLNKMFHID